MFGRLLLLMTLVPIVELILVLKIHSELVQRTDRQTGLVVSIGSILLTGVIGATLARIEGVGVLQRLRTRLSEGQLPGRELTDGVLIVLGGALLLTPGYLTDIVGLTFLIPFTRTFYRHALRRWFQKSIDRGHVQIHKHFQQPNSSWSELDEGPVIDVTPDPPDER